LFGKFSDDNQRSKAPADRRIIGHEDRLMSENSIKKARTEATDAQQRKPESTDIGIMPVSKKGMRPRWVPLPEASARHITYGTAASADAGAVADQATNGELQPTFKDAPEATRQPRGPATDAHIPSSDARPNGDEVDVRMEKIGEILQHAAMPLLEKCILVAEWVHHAEAKLSVFGQHEQKP
jgi:hypothetical protein